MGYTSYYRQKPKLNLKQWNKFIKDVKPVLDDGYSKNIIQKECEDNSNPVVDNKMIWFNGIGDNGYETFVLNRKAEKPDYAKDEPLIFNFCKTAEKPYDVYVVAVLVLAKIHFGEDIQISSDGNVSDWQKGVELVNELLRLNVKMTGDEVETAVITYDDPVMLKIVKDAADKELKIKTEQEQLMKKIDNQVKEELNSLVG